MSPNVTPIAPIPGNRPDRRYLLVPALEYTPFRGYLHPFRGTSPRNHWAACGSRGVRQPAIFTAAAGISTPNTGHLQVVWGAR